MNGSTRRQPTERRVSSGRGQVITARTKVGGRSAAPPWGGAPPDKTDIPSLAGLPPGMPPPPPRIRGGEPPLSPFCPRGGGVAPPPPGPPPRYRGKPGRFLNPGGGKGGPPAAPKK